MGFLDELWHHAAGRIKRDYNHPMDGLHDLADFAYNASGAHDVVDAAEDPTNWKADLKALAVIGGYTLPGVLEGRVIGKIGADTLGRFLVPTLPGMAEVAQNPTNPEGYIHTVLGAVPGTIPAPALDKAISGVAGPEKQAAIEAIIRSKLAGSSA
jgi:hypothetical protein